VFLKHIDRRKLLFLGRLCHTDPGKWKSTLFLQKLVKFMNSHSTTFGFLPDVYRILGKYSLKHALETFVKKAVFPKKSTWRRKVNEAIRLHVKNSHLDKSEDDWLQLFKNVHSKYEACILWHFSNLYRNYLKECKTTMALLSQIRFKTKQHQLHNVLT